MLLSGVDILRGVVAGLSAMVVGATFVVLVLYVRAWRRAPSGSGILPRHVIEVSAGTLCLVAGVGSGVYDTIGNPHLNYRLWVYLAGLLLILLSIVEVGRLQRHRLAAAKRQPPRHRRWDDPPPPRETER